MTTLEAKVGARKKNKKTKKQRRDETVRAATKKRGKVR